MLRLQRACTITFTGRLFYCVRADFICLRIPAYTLALAGIYKPLVYRFDAPR